MMPIIVTAAVCPVYMLCRVAFFNLPLHIDTGFYVSNDSVRHGRLDFRKGWNARFAGCSKVLAEFVYTWAYLASKRNRDKGWRYKFVSRLLTSAINYGTAILVGVLSYILSGHDVRFYYAGLIAFAMLSSEAQYGVYHECGEIFGVLGEVAAVVCVVAGVSSGDAWLVGIGSFIWAVEACFVKLSSAIALAVFFGVVLVRSPEYLANVLAGGGVAVALFAGWVLHCGHRPGAMLRSLTGHERAGGQRIDARTLAHRVAEKMRLLGRTVRRQPLIPAMAVTGIAVLPPDYSWVWLYLAAVTCAYLVQAADVWYYQIPLTPCVALMASAGLVAVQGTGGGGSALLLAALGVWLAHNPLRAVRSDSATLHRWCWNGAAPEALICGNELLECAVRQIRPDVRGRSLLVYGPFNQAYAMLDASYPTAIVTPEHYLDEMFPEWQSVLNRQLVSSPPEFVLDTYRCFDVDAARDELGLDYHLASAFADRIRLYRLSERRDVDADCSSARTFSASASSTPEAPSAGELAELLGKVAAAGYRRLGIYGAGRFTARHADVYRDSPVPIAAVFDDAKHGSRLLDLPVVTLNRSAEFDVDVVIVSTDRFVVPMFARAKRHFGDRVRVFRIGDAVHAGGAGSEPLRPELIGSRPDAISVH